MRLRASVGYLASSMSARETPAGRGMQVRARHPHGGLAPHPARRVSLAHDCSRGTLLPGLDAATPRARGIAAQGKRDVSRVAEPREGQSALGQWSGAFQDLLRSTFERHARWKEFCWSAPCGE